MLSTNIKQFRVAINTSLSNRKGPWHSSSATLFLRVLSTLILNYAGRGDEMLSKCVMHACHRPTSVHFC